MGLFASRRAAPDPHPMQVADFGHFPAHDRWRPELRGLLPGAQVGRGYMGEQRKNGVGQLSESRAVVTAGGIPYWQLAQVKNAAVYQRAGGSPAVPASPAVVSDWTAATDASKPTQGAGAGAMPWNVLRRRGR